MVLDSLEAREPMAVLPDSAVTLPGRPVVLPLREAQWRGLLRPALRIGRLGKCIEAPFGRRYVDAAALALHLRGLDEASTALERATAGTFDDAVTFGPWAEDVPYGPEMLDSVVSRVSRFVTIKTGDVVLLPVVSTLEPLRRERLDLSIPGLPPLSKRVI